MLITITLNGQKLSLCNIYAPNDQVNQLQFMQELNNCIIDKSELTSLIDGGDWNCTLSKKDKIGGAPWKPSSYRNLIANCRNVRGLGKSVVVFRLFEKLR